MSHLMAASEKPSFTVNAVDAPFDSKDRLKARGYRWNPVLRFWSRDIPEVERDAEEAWLKADVYAGHGAPAFLAVSACDRYKAS